MYGWGSAAELSTLHTVEHADGVLWCVGPKEIARFDGKTWTRLHHPDTPKRLTTSEAPGTVRTTRGPRSGHDLSVASSLDVLRAARNVAKRLEVSVGEAEAGRTEGSLAELFRGFVEQAKVDECYTPLGMANC